MHIVLAVVIGIPLFFWCLSSYQRRQVLWVERKLQREQREQEMEQQRQREQREQEMEQQRQQENAARERQMRLEAAGWLKRRADTRSYEQILEADRRSYQQFVEADRTARRRREQGVWKYLKAQGVISDDELSR
jgi:flagellar biosynthesis component FlhA